MKNCNLSLKIYDFSMENVPELLSATLEYTGPVNILTGPVSFLTGPINCLTGGAFSF